MPLYKITPKKGDSFTITAEDYFPLDAGYTIFRTGHLKEYAVETSKIDKIEWVTGNSGQFAPRQISP
jgi:hypothetical protein